MSSVFSTDVLTGVVNNLKPVPMWLLDRYFPMVQTEDSEEIHFDVVTQERNVAPFVSPLVAGKIVKADGYETKTFKPAYLKPKTPLLPRTALKRAAGEPIAGRLSAGARMDLLIRQTLTKHRSIVDRRLVVMAAEAMRTGKITVSGDEYPTVVVDFGRDANHTVVLGEGSKWGEDGVKPLADLQAWSLTALETEGIGLNDVIMTPDVWSVFKEDAAVEKRLDIRRVTDNSMRLDAIVQEGGVYMGTVDGFNIFVHAGWYIDPSDLQRKPIFPAGTVILTSPGMDGVRAFGAIQDHDAGLRAVPYFAKSWVEDDPSVRQILTQSAPLTVPHRINATFAVTVL